MSSRITATNIDRSRTAERSNRLPEGYVRPKRRPLARERLTIAKLIYGITCFALAFFLYPLVHLYPSWWIWCLMCGFVGSAIGIIRSGAEGAIFGFIFGLIFVPVGFICLHILGAFLTLLYIIFTDAEPGGLFSYNVGSLPSVVARVDLVQGPIEIGG